jgi:hypothetical protein
VGEEERRRGEEGEMKAKNREEGGEKRLERSQ